MTCLAEADFNNNDVENCLDKIPDLTKELVFAVKGSSICFFKALVKAIDEFPPLLKEDDEDYDNWGYHYSIGNYNFLKEWLTQNDR